MVKLQSTEKSVGLLSEPVLAQIPLGAPGHGYWTAIALLVWIAGIGVLAPLFQWLAPDYATAGEIIHRGFESPPDALLFWLGGAASVVLPFKLHIWLRGRLMHLAGASPRVVRRQGRLYACSDRPLPHRSALICLLAPLATLTSLGLLAMALRWPWGVMLIAVDWGRFAPDGSLAFRLLREPGCVWVHFRPDGVVLYGTSRTPTRETPTRQWATSLVMAAAPMSLPLFILSHFDADWFLVSPVMLAGTVVLAAFRVRLLRQRAQRVHHRRLEQEADEAREMQQSLLPAAPPQIAGVQLAALFQAAHEVSGDFYLFPSAPPRAVRLVLGDVAGKGLPSALTAALAVGFLAGGAEAASDPATLLEVAGRSLRAARHGRTLVATCAVDLEPESRRLRWCNAGVPPPALLHDGSVTWLPGTGIPLGSLPQITYEGQQTLLAAGDLLLFYTDGLVEATSPLGDLFGRERLAAALCRLPAGCTAEEALAHLQREVAHFIGDAEPYDDLTAVALRVE